MELIVVLMILVALAGLVVPLFPGMLTQAHTSTCSTNIAETSKAIMMYQAAKSAYPNNFDLMSDGATGIIPYFPAGSMLPAQYGGPGTLATMGGGQITQSNLTTAELSALNQSGIFSGQAMSLTPNDPTFDYYLGGSTGLPSLNAVQITAKTPLAFLDPVTGGPGSPAYNRCNQLGLPVTARYLVLGVGPRNDMIGATMLSAPVHFGDTPALSPEFGYERLSAFFKVSDTAVTNFTIARFMFAAPIHDDGVGSINDELQNWYQLQNGGT
jgi:type II secretory pathway pseudopilin PulG